MIALSKVSKWYQSFQVLKDCSTEVARGEVVVVCGPSGSGKSTLIKCVNGLEPFQQGKITVDGISVTVTVTGAVGYAYPSPGFPDSVTGTASAIARRGVTGAEGG